MQNRVSTVECKCDHSNTKQSTLLKDSSSTGLRLKAAGYPSGAAAVALVRDGNIINTPVTAEDMRRTFDIHEPSRVTVRGETTKQKFIVMAVVELRLPFIAQCNKVNFRQCPKQQLWTLLLLRLKREIILVFSIGLKLACAGKVIAGRAISFVSFSLKVANRVIYGTYCVSI